jgi:replicative DNA helicase
VSDLRGSGAIEEDAAGVMLIYPDKDDMQRRTADGTVCVQVKSWLRLGKNRFGLQGTDLALLHQKTLTRFVPYQEED